MRFFLIFSTLLGITICFAQETVTPETAEKTKKERILNMMKIMQANHTKVNQLFAELPLEDINKNSTLQTSIQTLKEATRTLDSLRIPDEQFNKNVTLLNRKLDGFLSDLRDGKPYPISPKLRWKKIRQACIRCHQQYDLPDDLLELKKYPLLNR